jgi:hypothetical protein
VRVALLLTERQSVSPTVQRLAHLRAVAGGIRCSEPSGRLLIPNLRSVSRLSCQTGGPEVRGEEPQTPLSFETPHGMPGQYHPLKSPSTRAAFAVRSPDRELHRPHLRVVGRSDSNTC